MSIINKLTEIEPIETQVAPSSPKKAGELVTNDAKLLDMSKVSSDDAESTLSNDASDFQTTGNPQEDLKRYAQLRGISLDQAKIELEAKFGKPNVPPKEDSSSVSASSTSATSADDFEPSGNPQEDVKKYAEMKGITEDQAKAELEAKFGKPTVEEKKEPQTAPQTSPQSSLLFTGEKNGKYYQDGILLTGLATDGKMYKDGVLLTGQGDDKKQYQDGVLLTGTYNKKYYQDGELLTGRADDGKYYSKGSLATGTFNGVYYKNGVESTKPATTTNSSSSSSTDSYASQRSSYQSELQSWTNKYYTACYYGDKAGKKYAKGMIEYYQAAIKNLDMARAKGKQPK